MKPSSLVIVFSIYLLTISLTIISVTGKPSSPVTFVLKDVTRVDQPYAVSPNVDAPLSDFGLPTYMADPDNVAYPSSIVDGAQLSYSEQMSATLHLGIPLDCHLQDSLVMPFETLQSAEVVDMLANLTKKASLAVLRPRPHFYHPSKKDSVTSSPKKYRLHCAQLSNWLDPFSGRWIAKYFDVSNVIAFPVCGKVDQKHTDMVCYLVDAIDQKEAACLQDYMMQDLEGRFPLLKRANAQSVVRPQTYCYHLMPNPIHHHLPTFLTFLLVVLFLTSFVLFSCCLCRFCMRRA